MTLQERRELLKFYIGKTVLIKIDRPIGYLHRKEKYSLLYPINYGYIPGVIGGDGEELDVYLLGVDVPLDEFVCEIIGAVIRNNDVEDKLIAAPIGKHFTLSEMEKAVDFQEKYYDSYVTAGDL